MLCQNCKQMPATSHIHSVVGGVVNDTYLCSECAANLKNSGFSHNDIFDLLSSFLMSSDKSAEDTVTCECCGTSFEEITKTGRVGCGNCYKVFNKQLSPALVRIHGKMSHVGKGSGMTNDFEQTVDTAKTKADRIEAMKKELEDAIKKEEYEKAAVLRDEIKKAMEEK